MKNLKKWQKVAIVILALLVIGSISNCVNRTGKNNSSSTNQPSESTNSTVEENNGSEDSKSPQASSNKPDTKQPSWRIITNEGDFDISVSSVSDSGIELIYKNNESSDYDMTELVNSVVVGETQYNVGDESLHMSINGAEDSLFAIQLSKGESATVIYSVDGMTQSDYEQGFGLKFDETSVLNTHDTAGAKQQKSYLLKSLSLRAKLT